MGCIGLWSYLITLDGPTLQKAAAESWRLVTTLHLPILIDADGNVVTPASDSTVRSRNDMGFARNIDVFEGPPPTNEPLLPPLDYPVNSSLDESISQAYVDYDNSSFKLEYDSSPNMKVDVSNYSMYKIAEDETAAAQELIIIPITGDTLVENATVSESSSPMDFEEDDLEVEKLIPTEITVLDTEFFGNESSEAVDDNSTVNGESDYHFIHDKNSLFFVDLPESSITDLGSGEIDHEEKQSKEFISDSEASERADEYDSSGDGEQVDEYLSSTPSSEVEEGWTSTLVSKHDRENKMMEEDISVEDVR